MTTENCTPVSYFDGSDVVNAALGMSDAMISEQAYLIARGVRPLMLFHLIQPDPLLMVQVTGRIERCAKDMAVTPFVFDDQSGLVWVGYAASKWVFDTFRWTIESLEEPHYSRVLGLLLGYTPVEIARYDAQQPIRGFKGAARLRLLGSTRPSHGADNTKTAHLPETISSHTHNSASTSQIFDKHLLIDPW